jgi:hypothetical protein
MSAYVKYRVADGYIVGSGICPPDMHDAQAGEGEAVLAVDYPRDNRFWQVVGGVLVERAEPLK